MTQGVDVPEAFEKLPGAGVGTEATGRIKALVKTATRPTQEVSHARRDDSWPQIGDAGAPASLPAGASSSPT